MKETENHTNIFQYSDFDIYIYINPKAENVFHTQPAHFSFFFLFFQLWNCKSTLCIGAAFWSLFFLSETHVNFLEQHETLNNCIVGYYNNYYPLVARKQLSWFKCCNFVIFSLLFNMLARAFPTFSNLNYFPEGSESSRIEKKFQTPPPPPSRKIWP